MEELEHDLQSAIPRLEEWKSHIVRSVHQDAAKTTVIDALSKTEALLIMDWAMKFLPTSYRETQRDWFGRKGKSWHITVAILRQDNENIKVLGQVLSHKIEWKFKLNSLYTLVHIKIFQADCSKARVRATDSL